MVKPSLINYKSIILINILGREEMDEWVKSESTELFQKYLFIDCAES